jgi:hypothetical protein
LPRLGSRVRIPSPAPIKLKQFQDIRARGTKPRGRFDTERNAKIPVKSKQTREKAGKSVHGVFSNGKLYVSTGTAAPQADTYARPPVNDLRKRSLRVRILALLPPRIASCSSGSISASQVGQRSLQRQSHSSHQFVPQGQVWCFRNHGIGGVLIQNRARGHGGFWDRLLAGRRPVRAARPMTMR